MKNAKCEEVCIPVGVKVNDGTVKNKQKKKTERKRLNVVIHNCIKYHINSYTELFIRIE